MMFNIGPQELLLILLVALIVVGPKRLPELSRSIGKGLRELRKAQDEVRKTINLGLDETQPTASKPRAGSRAATASPEGAAGGGSPEGAEGSTAAVEHEAETEGIARTLGRGLAEIRRSRQEIARTFRIDLSDRPSPRSDASTRAPSRPPRRDEDLEPGPTNGAEVATRGSERAEPPGTVPDEPTPPTEPRSAG
jgi:Tat protein translocase TatB subunit